jgi:hypothetical protein
LIRSRRFATNSQMSNSAIDNFAAQQQCVDG